MPHSEMVLLDADASASCAALMARADSAPQATMEKNSPRAIMAASFWRAASSLLPPAPDLAALGLAFCVTPADGQAAIPADAQQEG